MLPPIRLVFAHLEQFMHALVLTLATVGFAAAEPDPQMKAVLDAHAALDPKPIETLTPAEARKQPTLGDAVKAVLTKQGKPTAPEEVGKVADLSIPAAPPIPARVYTPTGAGPFPVLVYWHGGGWVLADLNTYDSSCRALCNAANCVVVSCGYRHAPEHPFPAAVDDALTAYAWVCKNAATLNGDPKRVAVAGESAGGNLAAVVTHHCRGTNPGLPAPVHQVLVYPVTDSNMDTPSYRENADAKPLNKAMMGWFFGHYVPDARQRTDTRVALLRAADLKGLPPATVILAEIDPLRSDGEQYAAKLQAAGVRVNLKSYPGVAHEFFGMGAVVDKAKEAVGVAAADLKAAFGK